MNQELWTILGWIIAGVMTCFSLILTLFSYIWNNKIKADNERYKFTVEHIETRHEENKDLIKMLMANQDKIRELLAEMKGIQAYHGRDIEQIKKRRS